MISSGSRWPSQVGGGDRRQPPGSHYRISWNFSSQPGPWKHLSLFSQDMQWPWLQSGYPAAQWLMWRCVLHSRGTADSEIFCSQSQSFPDLSTGPASGSSPHPGRMGAGGGRLLLASHRLEKRCMATGEFPITAPILLGLLYHYRKPPHVSKPHFLHKVCSFLLPIEL